MKKLLLLCSILIFFRCTLTYAQERPNPGGFLNSQAFDKELALYDAKSFLVDSVLGTTNEVVKFETIALAADMSGDLTTLLYKCESKQKEGMILAFYGTYWNDAGVIYTGYGFKNLDRNKAQEFLEKIENAIDMNLKYLFRDYDNNIYLTYDDITILISANNDTAKIRLIWNKFDSSWRNSSFEKTKKRFQKSYK